jgi:hypothetical protein
MLRRRPMVFSNIKISRLPRCQSSPHSNTHRMPHTDRQLHMGFRTRRSTARGRRWRGNSTKISTSPTRMHTVDHLAHPRSTCNECLSFINQPCKQVHDLRARGSNTQLEAHSGGQRMVSTSRSPNCNVTNKSEQKQESLSAPSLEVPLGSPSSPVMRFGSATCPPTPVWLS